MILKKLTINNIRSYKDATINFPIGSTLLMGNIGSGKTSILLAIEFALFGLQPSQRGNSLLRSNEDIASVNLEFEIDGKNIIIERSLKKTSKSITQTDAAITIDNERFEGSVTEIKNRILTLLSYPPEFAKKTNDLYKFTVYTPQEEMKQIILEPPETRLNTLRHVFGIDKYKRISENLSTLGVKLRQEIRLKEVQIGDVELKKSSLTETKTKLLEQQECTKGLDSEIARIIAQKEIKQTEIKDIELKINEKRNFEQEKEKSELMLSNKKENLLNHDKEITLIQQQIEEGRKFSFNQEELDALKTHITTQEQFLKQTNEEYLEVCSRIQGRDSKKQEADNLKNKIMGLEKCPTCMQEVNQQYKENIITNSNMVIKRVIEQNNQDILKKEELNTKIEQYKLQIETYKNSISEMNILKVKLQSLDEKDKKIEEIETQKSLVIQDLGIIQDQIKVLITNISEFEKYVPEFEQKNKELQLIVTQEHSIAINRAEVNKEIQFSEQQIKILEEEIVRLEAISKEVNHLKELESWLSSKFAQFILHTEKNVMLKLREEFSALFSEWFSILVAEELSVRIDETFTPIIQQQDYDLDYSFLSGGERTAVALAYRLALNQVINSLLSKIKTHDIVILDEPTDGFSDAQLDKMRDVLSQLKVKQLILVSHEQKMEGFVDNIIHMEKNEGITEIRE